MWPGPPLVAVPGRGRCTAADYPVQDVALARILKLDFNCTGLQVLVFFHICGVGTESLLGYLHAHRSVDQTIGDEDGAFNIFCSDTREGEHVPSCAVVWHEVHTFHSEELIAHLVLDRIWQPADNLHAHTPIGDGSDAFNTPCSEPGAGERVPSCVFADLECTVAVTRHEVHMSTHCQFFHPDELILHLFLDRIWKLVDTSTCFVHLVSSAELQSCFC